MAGDVHGGELGVGDLDAALVVAVVESGVDLQAGVGRGGADQVHDDFEGLQWLAAPVETDEAEQSMLDFVPLESPGRKVADTDAQPGRVSEWLQLVAPEAGAGVVGPAGVGGDRQCAGVRVAL